MKPVYAKIAANLAYCIALTLPSPAAKVFADTTNASGTTSGNGSGTASAQAADTCQTAFQTVMQSEPASTTYVSGMLYHLHLELYKATQEEPANIQQIFCNFRNAFGLTDAYTTLPQTLDESDPSGNAYELTLTVPTESFATSAGYVVKATVTFNGKQFLAMWWSGADTATAGYAITGANPTESDGQTRISYIRWDRTTAAQKLEALSAQFATATGFLGSTTDGHATGGGDHAEYSRSTYNTSTMALYSQSIAIRDGQTVTGFRCVENYFTGVLGGAVTGYKPQQASPYQGDKDPNSTDTNGVGLEGAATTDSATVADPMLTDATKVAAGTGPTFDHGCAYVYTAGQSGNPFASNSVNYALDPSQVFPQ